jgi:hypothetical protein
MQLSHDTMTEKYKRIFQSFRVAAVLIIIPAAFRSFAIAEPHSPIDSATAMYDTAARRYDTGLLKNAADIISRQLIVEPQSPRALLALGLVYWRFELIGYCLNNGSAVSRYGKMAIERLLEAEKAGADVYLTASHKALASQLLAGQSMIKGAYYGPRAAAELKKAQKANPQGYYSLLIEAINANQAPSFAGGNPRNAVALLEKMAKMFPDSIEVNIHLAEGYLKTGQTEDARKLIVSLIKEAPFNLLAKKVAAKLPEY